MQKPGLSLVGPARTAHGDDPIAELISALINEGDYDPPAHGIKDADFYAHRRVHEFCIEYRKQTGSTPTAGTVISRFADFPYNSEADLGWALYEARKDLRSRQLSKLIHRAATALADDSPEEAYAILTDGISQLPITHSDPVDASDVSLYFAPEPEGCPVYGHSLQQLSSGIKPGQIWYVGARPGRGKTWDIIMHAITAAEHGWNAVIFSLEMSASTVLKRMHKQMVGQHGDPNVMAAKVTEWFAQPGRGSIKVYDPSKITCDVTAIEKAAQPHTLVLIDYIGLMRTAKGERSVEDHKYAAVISNSIKEIALRRQVPIIAAAQLSRQAEERKPRMNNPQSYRNASGEFGAPSLNDLSGSTALEQDADLIYYIRGRHGSRVREKRIMKHRDGEDGQVWYIDFQPSACKFLEITTERARRILELERSSDDSIEDL